MKIILIFVIVFCFGLLGYKIAQFYICRKKFFSSFQILISSIESDVRFTQDKLKYIIKRNSDKLSSRELVDLCDQICTRLEHKENIDINIFDNIKILRKDEKEIIYKYFYNLGRFDVVSLGTEMNTYKNKIKIKCDESSEECKKYASLFIKLGIIVGLLVCLLVV